MLNPTNDKLLVRFSQENHKVPMEYCLIAARVRNKFRSRRIMNTVTKKSLVVIALTTSLFIGSTASALADVTPNPNKVAYDAAIAQYKVAMEKHKADMGSFYSSMKARNESRKAINATFKGAVDKAKADYTAAVATATTAETKKSALTTRKNAVSAASAIRDAAVTALGQLPVKPTAPVKPTRPEKVVRAPKAPRPAASVTPSA
jgi:hypothetical protein